MTEQTLTVAALLNQISRLENLIDGLQAKVSEQTAIITRQCEEIAELKRRLGQNSANSSKPPSSDGLSKPPRSLSLREIGQKKSGGQPGHKGQTLEQTLTPDIIERHVLTHCPGCSSSLSEVPAVQIVKRQVQDVPVPRPVWTEHLGEVKICPCCTQRSVAAFPKGVNAPVQYGERIKAYAMYLQHQQLIPEDRVQETLSDLFGLELATATLNGFSQTAYANLAGFENEVLEKIKNAPVKHLDETGFRIASKTQWLHTASTDTLTHYRTTPQRKALLEGLTGIVVHDHYKPYFQLQGVEHALCNAHHLRELKALIEHDKEPWARQMKRLLSFIAHYLKTHPDQPPADDLFERLTLLYRKIVERGIAYHERLTPLPQKKRGTIKRRPGLNLAFRLQRHENNVLRCLKNPLVPFSNNLAEQDIRMMKCKQKISGGFRTPHGAAVFARIRAFISTARKQGWNIFASLQALMYACAPMPA